MGHLVPTEHRRANECVGLLLLTLAILSGLSLISFNPDDPSLNISKNPLFDARPANFIGFAGAYTADMFFQLWGYSAFLIPIFLGIYAFYWLASWRVQSFGIRLSGMILMLLTLSVSFSMAPSLPPVRGYLPAGGLLGIVLADALEASLNPAGAVIVLAAAGNCVGFVVWPAAYEEVVAVAASDARHASTASPPAVRSTSRPISL